MDMKTDRTSSDTKRLSDAALELSTHWKITVRGSFLADLAAAVITLTEERDELRAERIEGLRIGYALTEDCQTVGEMAADLVRQVKEAREQRDAALTDLAAARPRIGVVAELPPTTIHERIAEALGWPLADTYSTSLPSLRELVRPVNEKLAHEITLLIKRTITR